MSDIKIEKIDNITSKVILTADESEIHKYEKQTLQYFREKKQLAGFRKGKAPDNLLKSKFGSEIEVHTINLFINAQLDVVDKKSEHGLYDVLKIDLKDKKKESYRFEIEFSNRPYVVFGKFKELSLHEDIPLIEDDDIEKDLIQMLRPHSRLELRSSEEGAQRGDFLTLEREILLNGVPEGEPSKDHCVLGDFNHNRELEEDILQKQGRVGEEFTVNISPLPDEVALDGKPLPKEIKLIMTIKEIKKLILPTLDDAFVKKKFPPYETVLALKEKIRKTQESIFRRVNIEHEMESAVGILLKNSSCYFPKNYLEKKLQDFLQRQKVSPDQLPAEEMKKLQEELLQYHQKTLLNHELLEKAKQKIADFNHEREFFRYVESELDDSLLPYITSLYNDFVSGKQLGEDDFEFLNRILQQFHWLLVFNYFKEIDLVKKGKKEKFTTYMEKHNQK